MRVVSLALLQGASENTIRPLVRDDSDSPYKTSREHLVISHPGGYFTITGGKLTTFRNMAQEMVDLVVRYIGGDEAGDLYRECRTKTTIPRISRGLNEETIDTRIKEYCRTYGLSFDIARHLVEAYGKGAETVLRFTDNNPDYLLRLTEGLPYIFAEIPYLLQNEMVMTLGDLIMRRTHLFFRLPRGREEVIGDIMEIMAAYLGWDDQRMEKELQWFRKAEQNFKHLTA